MEVSKAADETGWRAATSLQAGLAQTVEWYIKMLRSGEGMLMRFERTICVITAVLLSACLERVTGEKVLLIQRFMPLLGRKR